MKNNINFISIEKDHQELWRAKRACGAPWVSKSTHPRKLGNHVTVHRPPVRPHHRETNVHSSYNLGQKVLRILLFLTHRTPTLRIWHHHDPSPHPSLVNVV